MPTLDEALKEIEGRDAAWAVPCERCGMSFYGDSDYMHVPVERCPLVLKGDICREPQDHHAYVAATSSRDSGQQAGFDRRRLVAALRVALSALDFYDAEPGHFRCSREPAGENSGPCCERVIDDGSVASDAKGRVARLLGAL